MQYKLNGWVTSVPILYKNTFTLDPAIYTFDKFTFKPVTRRIPRKTNQRQKLRQLQVVKKNYMLHIVIWNRRF